MDREVPSGYFSDFSGLRYIRTALAQSYGRQWTTTTIMQRGGRAIVVYGGRIKGLQGPSRGSNHCSESGVP